MPKYFLIILVLFFLLHFYIKCLYAYDGIQNKDLKKDNFVNMHVELLNLKLPLIPARPSVVELKKSLNESRFIINNPEFPYMLKSNSFKETKKGSK